MLLATSVWGCALSGAALVLEARPFFATAEDIETLTDRLVAQPIVAGWSLDAERQVLNACVRAMKSAYGRILPRPERGNLTSHCLELAEQVVANNPSSAYAWYVEALAAAGDGNFTLLSDALMRSEQLAPNEEWLGTVRDELAEANLDHLTPDARAANDRDLAMLVSSMTGLAAIGARYIRDPDFRERIKEIVEQLPAADQRRFIGAVSRAAHG
ncbi:MAG TPA: hypothetical protein VL418_07895 [Devosiaceae bacterium]|nr:hypothetical protein [Devosiaceae bacterium]